MNCYFNLLSNAFNLSDVVQSELNIFLRESKLGIFVLKNIVSLVWIVFYNLW